MAEDVRPFRIHVSDDEIHALKARLSTTRWPDEETAPGWRQGTPVAWLRDLCDHWARGYDWRRCEERLNGLPQFTTTLDGLDVHFLHVRSPRPDAVPLLMTHGWPGSIVEFLDVIGPLADGGLDTPAFHVVCPSLPGFAFSARPRDLGWGPERIADAWAVLMARLGYERYFVQGGDWGSFVSSNLAVRYPEHVAGVHLNMPIVPPDPETEGDRTETERKALADIEEQQRTGRGYSAIQSTRPQTIGYALTDSPAALCAWIADKLHAWTDHDGNPFDALSPDQMLDNISVYWFTGTGASAARIYWESAQTVASRSVYRQARQVPLPSAISVFPREISRPSRRWCEKYFTDLRFYEEPRKGGHFAAFEQPEIFVDQVRRGVASML